MVTIQPSKIQSVDSCVILRALEGDVPEQREKALSLFLNGADFYVSETVLCEVIYVMAKHHYERAEIINKLTVLLNNPMFFYDRRFFDPIFKDYLKYPSLSFEDLVIAKRAKEMNCVPLWTFDKKLAKQSEEAKLLA